MGRAMYFLLTLSFVAYLFGAYSLGKNSKKAVLGVSLTQDPIPTILPTDTPTPVPTQTPTSTPKATVKPTPVVKATSASTPTAVPKPISASSQEINGYIDRFSAQYGVDANVLRHIALCESGFNSSSINGVYVGLYQFSPSAWTKIRAEIGEDTNGDLRFSAEESVQTAAYTLSKQKSYIWPNCVP
jgi:hypothetical protein